MRQVTSGIPGLDEILDGGFTRPSTILVAGTAGAGKTTFVMQSIFDAARNDEVCLYVTSLSEPLAMINNFMSRFTFYNVSLLAQGNVKYMPIDPGTLDEGADAFLKSLENMIDQVKPDRIVIDPLTAIALNLDEGATRRFYYDLFVRMKSWNALVIVTGEFTEDEVIRSELSYVADGIMYLSNDLKGDHRVRHLEVLKMRGQNCMTGKHTYSISESGVTVYPKIRPQTTTEYKIERISTGIEGLDEMMSGGLLTGTSTIISGGSGTGKTVIGLHFITEGAKNGEPGVIVSFEEDEEQLKAGAKSIGKDLDKYIESGIVRVMHTLPAEMDANAHAIKLKSIIEEMDAKRVLIDGIYGFQPVLDSPMELREHIHMLSDYFKSRNITAIFTNEQKELTGSLTIAGSGESYVMDAAIMLRYVEIQSRMRKAISVLKMRGSNHDKDIREFEIDNTGIHVKLPFSNYAGIMSGSPTKTARDAFVEAFRKK